MGDITGEDKFIKGKKIKKEIVQGLHIRGRSSRIEPILQNQLLQVSLAS